MTLMEKHVACLADLYDERLQFAGLPEMAWWVERLDRKIATMELAIARLRSSPQ